MPLFEVDKDTKQVEEIRPTTFPDLRLWERQDLEAWVTSAPELAGGDFTVVTSEFDRFDRTSERLDVLGIVPIAPGHGRLVVVELKRDGTSTTVDLQAIKYAAYVAAAQFAETVEMYAHHHGVPEENARAALLELLGGTEDDPPLIDDTPRIVLVAGDFRPEVTTTVLWLVDNFEEMDIRCVRLQPFKVGERILVHSEVLIPLPEAEQYRLGVRRKRREVAREQEQKARAGRLLPRLLEAGALSVGQILYFRRDAIPDGAPPWSTGESLYQATLVDGEGIRALEWVDPETGEPLQDSASLLAARILHRLGQRSGKLSSAGVNGMHYWTADGEISLRDLAAETGVLDRSGRHIDRSALRSLCGSIPSGTWTTYGDVAEAIGVPGAAQSVAGVLATDHSIPNAHRVLRSTGRISPGFVTAEGEGPHFARARLEAEGVRFDASGTADAASRWQAADSTNDRGPASTTGTHRTA
jgi:alkylated DNA nucleotide flippase Atl1